MRRDPRIAIHSPTIEPPAGALSAAPRDAKLAATVVEIAPPSDNPYEGKKKKKKKPDTLRIWLAAGASRGELLPPGATDMQVSTEMGHS